ncbi:hypothetical protein NDU88_005011 [Pleurodeles waltl]|uniref:Uncharacterized protein n=1 Tax=Pleurodeles waltl TaxID=8319 RepID=A0AAV7VLZ7_PLEWA|nr:hypothetical protein NDU88_005011 [Pleurodeles waltl]
MAPPRGGDLEQMRSEESLGRVRALFRARCRRRAKLFAGGWTLVPAHGQRGKPRKAASTGRTGKGFPERRAYNVLTR